MSFSSSELAIIKMYLPEQPRQQVIKKIESILPYLSDEHMKNELCPLVQKLMQISDDEFNTLDFSDVPDLIAD